MLARVRKLTKAKHLPERQLHAAATIAPGGRGRFHLRLVVRVGGLVGVRAIDGRSCEDLAGATAVVLALLLSSAEPLRGDDFQASGQAGPDQLFDGSSAGGSTGGDEQTRTLEPARPGDSAEPEPEPTPLNSEEAPAPRRWRGALQLPIVSVGIGPLPGPSFSFSLAGGILLQRWSFFGEAGVWLKQELKATDDPDSGADVHRIEAAVRSCRAIVFGHFEVAPCVRLALQHMWARGTGAHIAAQTAQATWLAVGLGVQARYQFSHWLRVFSGVDAHLETARPRLSIDGVGSLGQLWPAAFTISVGSEWIL